ncbi:MAG: DNA alkylation repair protein [Acidimicrobiia bacterium]|nr:DNA alkylation repair protein [Acidimicrobiia bacterium]
MGDVGDPEVTASRLVAYTRHALYAVADPAKAGPMAAYMKTTVPFYGVPTPRRRPIARELKRRFPPDGPDQYRGNVLALWGLDHREEKYLAIAYAGSFRQFISFEQIDLYERLVEEGAWWDFVDFIASDLLGKVVLDDRQRMRPILENWIDHDDMWLRRAAILCQLRHKAQTDEAMLFDFCLRRAHEKEFFIRKAIGWALREYAKTNAELVRRFLAENEGQLSGLSRREAGKHLL